jgi:protein arginine N-methyltransferase 3
MANTAEDLDNDEDIRFSDWSEDAEEQAVRSLFAEVDFTTVADLIQHDSSTFGFNIVTKIMDSGKAIDEISVIKLVNFVRAHVKDLGRPYSIEDTSNLLTAINDKRYLDDRFMMPVLADDALLYRLPEYLEAHHRDVFTDPDEDAADLHVAAVLQRKLQMSENLIRSLASENVMSKSGDSDYFGSYSHIGIHEEMLRDSHRTSSYADAISAASHLIRGKVVLDVGCGTGILSMLAARAGARKVIGIDVSGIVPRTRRSVERNGLAGVVTIIQGKLENCVDEIRKLVPLTGTVDVIISEWMGYALYYENMFPSVILARDLFMPRGSDGLCRGLMMPSIARLFLEAATAIAAAGNVEDDRVLFWSNVYGFDMSDMSELLISEAQVQTVGSESIFSQRQLVHNLDLRSAENKDLDFRVNFDLVSAILRLRFYSVILKRYVNYGNFCRWRLERKHLRHL